MKRSRMPDRTTPLRRAPFQPASGPALRPVRARKTPQSAEEKAAQRLVRARSAGWCELQLPGVCVGRAFDFSHRIAAGRGGKWCASNGCDACRFCHMAITNTNGHRAAYMHQGYICSTNADATSVAVWLRGERWVYLTDDGQYLDSPPLSQQKGA